MKDVYQRLAEFFDTMPQRYPLNTESGLEIKILKHIYEPADAEIVMKLKAKPETAAEISERIGKNPEDTEKLLFDMSKKGQIFRTGQQGSYKYMASAFLVGIIEFQMNRMTVDLARDMEAFAPALLDATWMQGETRDLRTIPISESVDADTHVMPYENVEEVIKSSKYIAISECMCRKIKDLLEKPCQHPSEVCFHFGSGTHYFVENGLGRYITQEEAMDILKKGVESGLVCQMSASQKPMAMCMCCACCCIPLSAFIRHPKPSEMINSSFFARVATDDCTGCELCADRCPMGAISVDDVAKVNPDRCIGCGVCAVTCPTEAIKVFRKDKNQEFIPEKDLFSSTMAIYEQRRRG